MLFTAQLKTSDDFHLEQAPIDDKKEEESWLAFRASSDEGDHRKMSALYEDDNDVHHCSNSWTSS